MEFEQSDLVELAKFVFNTVGCDLHEYHIEPYSSLMDDQHVHDDQQIGEALVQEWLKEYGG